MKQVRHIYCWVAAALLFGGVADASALTLGSVRGAAFVGRPLALTVTVEFAADEDATPDVRAMCYVADVRFGDDDVPSRKVQIDVSQGATSRLHSVHISTTSLIDEPTVSVSLQAGCVHKTVRRYVVLSEMLTELLPDAAAIPAVSMASVAPVVSTAPVSVAAARSVPAAEPVAASRVAEPDATAQAEPKVKDASRTTSAVRSHKSGKRSRLKLSASPVEVSQAHGSKASRRADALALEELQKRVDALAQWKESQPSVEQTTKMQARVQAFESDLKGLHALTLKNQQSLQMVAADLEHMQSGERDGNLLLYALTAVLALCVAAVVWLVLRVRGAYGDIHPWWSGEAKVDKSTAAAYLAAAQVEDPPPREVPVQSHAPKPVIVPVPTGVDIDLGLDGNSMEEARGVAPVVGGGRTSDKRDFQHSNSATLRSINTTEMLDVRQQAEFFMALGQHDEAVKVLETSITQSHDANPLVILDLLKIFHTLGRRPEFDHYRQEFNLQFTGRVPNYASFMLEGHGLDTYEDICRELITLWPTDDAIEFIEQCLVRTPDDGPDQGFDLEAYRDLLLLHGVLKRLDPALESNLIPFSATRNVSPALDVADAFVDSTLADQTVTPPSSSAQLPVQGAAVAAVDLDLTESRDNLIDFDISGFTLDNPPRTPPK